MRKIIASLITFTLLSISSGAVISFASTNPIDIGTFPDKVLFDAENMKPGDGIKRVLTIQNRGTSDFTYNAIVDFTDGSKILFNAFLLEVRDSKGLLFDGKLSEFTGFDKRALEVNHEEELEFVVKFPEELGNEYQGLAFQVEIKFVAEEIVVDSEEVTTPQTPIDPTDTLGDGDILPSTATNMYSFLLIGLLIVITGTGLYLFNRRKTNE
ncbi:LPXTG cell wall anchor domain-containing protein [Aquibacillus rhizosphaerae]|uniref:LPXTG cell wall anchor domain-containing protein n=1 Tax=Aquibacillus rhizosphaerae TaxID=3051431 RepID=A0ABT7L1D2_9BACI|nr:LPXTG cell wall anchor domain-containing protein [Aquibacillus sp. LR5S19]MDL4838940.1 LPXTG cell wall anchor domain-containing protein [Aquibacillus sp. LR5S19]